MNRSTRVSPNPVRWGGRALLPWTLAALLCSGASVLLAMEPQQGRGGGGGGGGGIGQAMGAIGKAVKSLSEGITKDNAEEALGHLEAIERAILDAKVLEPEAAAEIDEKKRPAYVAEYRTMMIDLLVQVAEAESAVVAGKYKNAEKIIGKLETLKGKGHGKFNPGGR